MTAYLTDAENRLKAMLANCPAFQTFCGVASEAAALPRIFIDAVPEPSDKTVYTQAELQAIYPGALVYNDREAGGLVIANIAHPLTPATSGRVIAELVRPVPAGARATVDGTLKSALNDILTDVVARHGQAGYLEFKTIECEGPYRFGSDEIPAQFDADYQGADFGFTWGINA